MNKLQLELKKPELNTKLCFGTKEYSKSSGICKGCAFKTECGKIKESKE